LLEKNRSCKKNKRERAKEKREERERALVHQNTQEPIACPSPTLPASPNQTRPDQPNPHFSHADQSMKSGKKQQRSS
ncbi:hypothetical protein COCCADRAFT_97347, partial [Bipolaris zeicola 26-R-13]